MPYLQVSHTVAPRVLKAAQKRQGVFFLSGGPITAAADQLLQIDEYNWSSYGMSRQQYRLKNTTDQVSMSVQEGHEGQHLDEDF